MPDTPDKPKRPDVEGIEAEILKLRAVGETPWGEDIPALIAWIEALEARQVKLEAVVAPFV